MNLQELLETLRNEDEVTLLELLDLKADDIVDRFLDTIMDNQQRIVRFYEE